MTYDNVKRVLYILLFIGIMICEIIYFLRVRKDYKCIIDLAKMKLLFLRLNLYIWKVCYS